MDSVSDKDKNGEADPSAPATWEYKTITDFLATKTFSQCTSEKTLRVLALHDSVYGADARRKVDRFLNNVAKIVTASQATSTSNVNKIEGVRLYRPEDFFETPDRFWVTEKTLSGIWSRQCLSGGDFASLIISRYYHYAEDSINAGLANIQITKKPKGNQQPWEHVVLPKVKPIRLIVIVANSALKDFGTYTLNHVDRRLKDMFPMMQPYLQRDGGSQPVELHIAIVYDGDADTDSGIAAIEKTRKGLDFLKISYGGIEQNLWKTLIGREYGEFEVDRLPVMANNKSSKRISRAFSAIADYAAKL